MKKLLVLLFIGLLISSPASAKTESSSEDATSVLLYGKYNDTLVPVKVAADGSIVPKQMFIDSSQDLGTVIDTIEASGLATQLNLAPGTYNECGIDITAPVNLSIVGSGVANTIIRCDTTATETVIAVSGQDATSFIGISNLTIDLDSTNGALYAIQIDQSAGTELLSTQVNLDNINIFVNGVSQTDCFEAVDIAFFVNNFYCYNVSTATGSNSRGIYQRITSGIAQNLSSEVRNSYIKVVNGSTSSSFSARGLMYWYNNSTHSFTNTVNTYNTYVGAEVTGSGGESLACYCVNDDSAGGGGQTCNYYQSVCQGYGTTGTRRAVRYTADANGPLQLNMYGTRIAGTQYLANLFQSSGSASDIQFTDGIYGAWLRINADNDFTSQTYTGTGAGLDPMPVFNVEGGPGLSNASTSAQCSGTCTSGEGADAIITAGVGGSTTATTGAGVAGSGGDFVLTSGNGGAQTNASGTTNTGGAGGDFSIIAGNGGAANSGSSTDTGGVGGSIFINAGLGGVGTDSTGRDGAVFLGGVTSTTSRGRVQLNIPQQTIAADDTTPQVSYSTFWVTSANTGATAITDLDNPTPGQVVCIIGGSDTNSSTIADSGNFALSAAMTLNVNDTICLYVQADNDYVEISRTNN